MLHRLLLTAPGASLTHGQRGLPQPGRRRSISLRVARRRATPVDNVTPTGYRIRMQRADIILGEEYAYREGRSGPLERIRIVQPVRGNKWKAEWIDPNPGLVDYVDGRALVVRWAESEAFLADEQSDRRLREDNEAQRYDDDSPLAGALYTVFDAAGDQVRFYRGDLSGPAEALERVRSRAKIEPSTRTALEYVDRHGKVHLPVADAQALARAFCEAEADTIIGYLELSDRPSIAADLFAKHRASDALVLQWCGSGPAELRSRENERLRTLILKAADTLHTVGRIDAAQELRRELGAIGGRTGSEASPVGSATGKLRPVEPATWTWRGRERSE